MKVDNVDIRWFCPPIQHRFLPVEKKRIYAVWVRFSTQPTAVINTITISTYIHECNWTHVSLAC